MHTNAIIAATRTTFESKEESITGKLILRNTNIGSDLGKSKNVFKSFT